MQETEEIQVQFLSREDPLENEMTTIPVFLPGEFTGQKSLVGYSPKSLTQLSTNTQQQQHIQSFINLGSILPKQVKRDPRSHAKLKVSMGRRR